MRNDILCGSRYVDAANAWVVPEIADELPYLDYHQTLAWYGENLPKLNDRIRRLARCGIVQADGAHRPEAQRIAPAPRQLFDRQA